MDTLCDSHCTEWMRLCSRKPPDCIDRDICIWYVPILAIMAAKVTVRLCLVLFSLLTGSRRRTYAGQGIFCLLLVIRAVFGECVLGRCQILIKYTDYKIKQWMMLDASTVWISTKVWEEATEALCFAPGYYHSLAVDGICRSAKGPV